MKVGSIGTGIKIKRINFEGPKYFYNPDAPGSPILGTGSTSLMSFLDDNGYEHFASLSVSRQNEIAAELDTFSNYEDLLKALQDRGLNQKDRQILASHIHFIHYHLNNYNLRQKNSRYKMSIIPDPENISAMILRVENDATQNVAGEFEIYNEKIDEAIQKDANPIFITNQPIEFEDELDYIINISGVRRQINNIQKKIDKLTYVDMIRKKKIQQFSILNSYMNNLSSAFSFNSPILKDKIKTDAPIKDLVSILKGSKSQNPISIGTINERLENLQKIEETLKKHFLCNGNACGDDININFIRKVINLTDVAYTTFSDKIKRLIENKDVSFTAIYLNTLGLRTFKNGSQNLRIIRNLESVSIPDLDPITYLNIRKGEFSNVEKIPIIKNFDSQGKLTSVKEVIDQIAEKFEIRKSQGEISFHDQIGETLAEILRYYTFDLPIIKLLADQANRRTIFNNKALKNQVLLELYTSGKGYKLLEGTKRKIALGWSIISENTFHQGNFSDPKLNQEPIRPYLINEFKKIKKSLGLTDQQLPICKIAEFVDDMVFKNTDLAWLKGHSEENIYTFGDFFTDFPHQEENLSPSKDKKTFVDKENTPLAILNRQISNNYRLRMSAKAGCTTANFCFELDLSKLESLQQTGDWEPNPNTKAVFEIYVQQGVNYKNAIKKITELNKSQDLDVIDALDMKYQLGMFEIMRRAGNNSSFRELSNMAADALSKMSINRPGGHKDALVGDIDYFFDFDNKDFNTLDKASNLLPDGGNPLFEAYVAKMKLGKIVGTRISDLIENNLAGSLYTPHHWRYPPENFNDSLGLGSTESLTDDPELLLQYLVAGLTGANPKKIAGSFGESVGGISVPDGFKGALDMHYIFNRHKKSAIDDRSIVLMVKNFLEKFGDHRSVEEIQNCIKRETFSKGGKMLVFASQDGKNQSRIFDPDRQFRQQLQFTIMFGDIPLIITKKSGSATLNLIIPIFDVDPSAKEVINVLTNLRKEIQKVHDLAPGSGGRGEHVVMDDGSTITQMTALTLIERSWVSLDTFINTMETMYNAHCN